MNKMLEVCCGHPETCTLPGSECPVRATPIQLVVAILIAAGYQAAGSTPSEEVRVGTRDNPVYGKAGGKLTKFGGRLRFRRLGATDLRVTVGPRTVCFYEVQNGESQKFTNFATKDVEHIREFISQYRPVDWYAHGAFDNAYAKTVHDVWPHCSPVTAHDGTICLALGGTDDQAVSRAKQITDDHAFAAHRDIIERALTGTAIMLNTELKDYEDEPWAQAVRTALELIKDRPMATYWPHRDDA